MGIYSSNRCKSITKSSFEIAANESYYGSADIQRMLQENCENDYAIFEAVINSDFQEAVGIREGSLLKSDIVALQEANIKSFFETIKKNLQKVWEKIKGVVKGFIAKIKNKIIANNKNYVKNAESSLKNKDLTGFTYRYEQPKQVDFNIADLDTDEINSEISKMESVEEINKFVADEIASGNLLEVLLGQSIKEEKVSEADYPKKAHEYYYENEEKYMIDKDDDITLLFDTILAADALIKKIEGEMRLIDTAFDLEMRSLKRTEESMEKNEDSALKMAQVNAIQQATSVFQKACILITSATIENIKFGIAQSRRIIAEATGYVVKEDAVFVEAASEAADYETEILFGW